MGLRLDVRRIAPGVALGVISHQAACVRSFGSTICASADKRPQIILAMSGGRLSVFAVSGAPLAADGLEAPLRAEVDAFRAWCERSTR